MGVRGKRDPKKSSPVLGESDLEAQFFFFKHGLTTVSNMASTTASRAATVEARHGLRHEAADVSIVELKEEAVAAVEAAARLKAEHSARLLVCACVLYSTQSAF